ncbi:hypothetical protein BCT86_06540 [Vibrio breoganii]|uniref:UPF0319 protein A6E01_14405 n=1 Tax=Vibrio breoganii TaxID=553239 RepID=A0AAN0XXM2_9VIBR|nr:DUF2057 family protein [Vibrio breoganii]ANO34397.1 hypothetical protein A6E01_14405 [Vibrio breoganii]OED85194.1 hypothetical protein A1QE_11515 [Vibrio breoganii ZF-55]PMK46501.1 hypothetical protein BCU00_07370 [Vibrio breoganii]PML09269.1 hypothetical protein BCT86_06540 [Vibrio breoganii]PMM19664.1 hypothetical protein BCT59_08855 [Vibrio breoganii]
MYKKILLTGLALSLTAPAFAEVTIGLPEDVDLLLVNGTEPEIDGGFFSSSSTAILPDGENQIVFRYVPSFKQGQEFEKMNSDVIVAKFTAENENLEFEFPKYRNIREAQRFNSNPDWKLVNESNQTIEMTQDKLVHEGMQIGRDYETEMIKFNAAGGAAAIATTNSAAYAAVTAAQASGQTVTVVPVAETATTNATPTQLPETTTATTEEEMLMFWYGKADDATKARFKAYVNSQ